MSATFSTCMSVTSTKALVNLHVHHLHRHKISPFASHISSLHRVSSMTRVTLVKLVLTSSQWVSASLSHLGKESKKKVFFLDLSQICLPTHPRVFVRFGRSKGEIRVEKGDFRGDLGWLTPKQDPNTSKPPQITPKIAFFRPKFHLSFSQILQKPWGG